jgi:hypothetical protein
MLDIFASLGVRAFDLTQTDIEGQKRRFQPAVDPQRLRCWVPPLLESAMSQQHNLIVRPQRTHAELIQLDDLSGAVLDRLKPTAFLILATSAGNHQIWVAVPECAPNFARLLRQGSGADPSASGAVRLAGSLNFKLQYAPNFPTVRILQATPGCTVTPAELQALGLVAAPEPPSVIHSVRRSQQPKQWPSYERCVQLAPPIHQGDRADISRADFTFCLLAIDWGWSLEDTYERLLEKSSKARENGVPYARRTAQRAAAAIHRRNLNTSP